METKTSENVTCRRKQHRRFAGLELTRIEGEHVMKNLSAFRSILAAGVALGACPAAVLAQDATPADTTGEIVVTALKRQYFGDTPVKEIPQAVQFLEGKLLDDLNIPRLDTALELASGVSRQNNF